MTEPRVCTLCNERVDRDGLTESDCYGDGPQCEECFSCYCDLSC